MLWPDYKAYLSSHFLYPVRAGASRSNVQSKGKRSIIKLGQAAFKRCDRFKLSSALYGKTNGGRFRSRRYAQCEENTQKARPGLGAEVCVMSR